MESLLRLLSLVIQRLGADDARVEIGGRPPEDERLLFATLPMGYRVVAIFNEAPDDRAGRSEKLSALVSAFSDVGPGLEEVRLPEGHRMTRGRLEELLGGLADETGARMAFVVDDRSPMIWGSHNLPRGVDAELLMWVAEVDGRARSAGATLDELLAGPMEDMESRLRAMVSSAHMRRDIARDLRRFQALEPSSLAMEAPSLVLAARALSRIRTQESAEPRMTANGTDEAFLSRTFANIYRAALVFEGSFSELHAEAALLRVLPQIEYLVLSLPPVDPVSGGAKVLRMPRRLR